MIRDSIGCVRRSIQAAILVALFAAGVAHAETRSDRVVLADPDPELRIALESALAPWRLEVIVDATPLTDPAAAQLRADTQTARFVVWRQDGNLVVFDRERRQADQRPSPDGALDPVSAASAALTVKTLMRLSDEAVPPRHDRAMPPRHEPNVPLHAGCAEPGCRAGDATRFRVQAGVSTRATSGRDADVTARFGAGAMVGATRWMWLGVAGELGPRADIKQSAFRGTWRDSSLLALGSLHVERGAWAFEPHVGAGIAHSSLAGVDGMDARSESTILPAVRAGMWVQWRRGTWGVGGGLHGDALIGTPTYTRATGQMLFEVPGFAVSASVMLTATLEP